jgi:hypothetical protein
MKKMATPKITATSVMPSRRTADDNTALGEPCLRITYPRPNKLKGNRFTKKEKTRARRKTVNDKPSEERAVPTSREKPSITNGTIE